MKDFNGRNINYLRISLTEKCNLKCIYCMPENQIQNLSDEKIMAFSDILKIITVATSLGINKIRYTGGEPLIVKNIEKLIYETSKFKEIDDIAITTNGILLADMAYDLKKAGLKRVNISLDTLDKQKFMEITRLGDLERVLKAIDKCLSIGLQPIKINTVLMEGVNDIEIKDFINLTRDMPLEIRFIELMPIGAGRSMYKKDNNHFLKIQDLYPELIKIEDEKSSTSQLYKLKGAKGRVGVISPISCKFCHECNKIRITSTGALKACLHSDEDVNIMEYINDEQKLKAILYNTIFNKPLEHKLEEENFSRSSKMMYQIGG